MMFNQEYHKVILEDALSKRMPPLNPSFQDEDATAVVDAEDEL